MVEGKEQSAVVQFRAGETQLSDFVSGCMILIDKPYGWTSFDVVGKLRWLLCRKLGIKKLKVGHGGTLDPLATGVMVICTGKATKTIDKWVCSDKAYEAEMMFGKTTPSFDLEKYFDGEYPTEHLSGEYIESVLEKFRGKIMQVPPLFSAKQIAGQRAYELARKGADVELEAREVCISELSMLDWQPNLLKLRIKCSKGTYIRSMARDIGEACGSGAYLHNLRRIAVGRFRIEDCISPKEFEDYLREL